MKIGSWENLMERGLKKRNAARGQAAHGGRLFEACMLLFTVLLMTVAPGVCQAGAAPAGQSQVPTVAVSGPGSFLAWDADIKEFNAKADDLSAQFTFYVTNISAEVVVITNLHRTCGCTEASMPSQPWRMEPGDSGPIRATIDLRGKMGRISKQLLVQTSEGDKALTLNVNIPGATAPESGVKMDRELNRQIAARDRQAVFKGECAKCHVEPTVGKLGHELYKAGCAICHEAENRAAMVPDLHGPKHPTDAEQWRQWITTSKPGSMMPAFAKAFDGPLSDEQIGSLVDYLSRRD
jgi:mono/diheme cytochrome c family protein